MKDKFQEVFDWCQDNSPDALEFVEKLLQECRVLSSEPDENFSKILTDKATVRLVEQIVDSHALFRPNSGDSLVSLKKLEALFTEINRKVNGRSINSLLALHKIAEHIDRAIADNLHLLFLRRILRNGGEMVLKDADIFTIPRLFTSRQISQMSGRANRGHVQQLAADCLTNCSLHAASDIQVTVMANSFERGVNEATGTLRNMEVAVGILNHADQYELSDCHISPIDDTMDYFFGYCPDNETQAELVLNAVGSSYEIGVDVLVLPECIANTEQYEHILKAYSPEVSPKIAVLGSCHLIDNGKNVNRCNYFVRGLSRVQEKSNGVIGKSEEGRLIAEELHDPKFEVTVHIGRDWSFAVMICKDFITPSFFNVLQRIAPSFVAVPALSRTLEPFLANATQLCVEQHCTIVLANHPGAGSTENAAFLWPEAAEEFWLKATVQDIEHVPLLYISSRIDGAFYRKSLS